jgi:hypothetical protein
MGLLISQTHARIGIETTPSRLEMQTRNTQVSAQHKIAKLNVRTETPQVIIDQHDAFASAGLMTNPGIIEDAAQRGKQQALDYIGKTAEDGDRLAAIEKGGNPIADIAERDAFPEHEFGYDIIPKQRPKIDVKGNLSFNPEPINDFGMRNGVRFTVIQGGVRFSYTPATIKVYLAQHPSIQMSYEGTKIDSYI